MVLTFTSQVLHQQLVDEHVSAANLPQKDALGSIVEEAGIVPGHVASDGEDETQNEMKEHVEAALRHGSQHERYPKRPEHKKRAREELSRLTLERQATAEQIDRRIRSALHRASASYPNIGLSRDAAEASGKNLELVTDQYVRGLVSIVDLIDAQDSALISEQNAQNAVYDFLVDWMNVGRASGQFDFFMTSVEKQEWFQQLEIFFEKSGVKLRKR